MEQKVMRGAIRKKRRYIRIGREDLSIYLEKIKNKDVTC